MRHTNYLFAFFGCVFTFCSLFNAKAIVFDPSDDNVLSLNGAWDFHITFKNDTSFDNNFYKEDYQTKLWKQIAVPSNWELMGFEEPTYFYPDKNVTGYYRKTISIPENLAGKQLFLHFDGVAFAYELYINGEIIGKFESAFNHAQFDVTNHIQENSNTLLIALKVYRSHKHLAFDCNDDWALSGIYRDVYLIGMPDTYIGNYRIETDIQKDGNAEITGKLTIGHIPIKKKEDKPTPTLKINVNLKDAEGKAVAQESVDLDWAKYEIMPKAEFNLPVNNPQLWNAEYPYLYTLEMELLKDGEVIQNIADKVGIRTVHVDRNGLKINGKNVKIRGVCRHEIHPERGRALREQDWLQDIELMKEANINAVRCSHYPPHPRFLELCDEYGFYVVNEVPFGYGEKLLDDADLLGELLSRAKRTLDRDINHPSVIIWSIGNENPITDNVKAVAQYVKLSDTKRPILFPHNNFSWEKFGQETGVPSFTDIYANHYSNAENIENFANDSRFDIPFLFTEYNHSLDEAFGALERKWDVMYQYDNLIGGYIWLWADQGLYRYTKDKTLYNSNDSIHVLRGKDSAVSTDFWVAEDTVMDSHGVYGTDGIVRANRFPQTDYWETRKVYSPVKVKNKKLAVTPGREEEIMLTFTNYYNFTNLDKTTIDFELLRLNQVAEKGKLVTSVNPGNTEDIALSLSIPADVNEVPYFLKIQVTDWNNIRVYEHTMPLNEASFKGLSSYRSGTTTKVQNGGATINDLTETLKIAGHVMNITLDKENLLSLAVDGKEILSGVGLRITRNLTMAEQKTYEDRGDPKFSFGIKNSSVTRFEKTDDDNMLALNAHVQYTLNNHPNAVINVAYHFVVDKNRGKVDVLYEISSENFKGYFPELGVDFYLPKEFNAYSWSGKGPYPSFPEKSALAIPGFYTLTASDPYFGGNRSNVSFATVYNSQKQGLIYLGNDSNIAFSETEEHNMLSHIILVAGLGTKFKFPVTTYKADEIGVQRGQVSFVPLELIDNDGIMKLILK